MDTTENLKDIVKTGYGIARFLKEHGVKYVFGIPDGHTLALYDGILANEGIEHILFNDERSAAFAADAYARVTGQLGVCDAGAAGSMNFPVALAEAKGSASPVLAIVGTIKSKDTLRNIPHDINVADTLAPITKWTERIMNTEYLPRFLSFAIKQATNGRPGPVALVISEDVLNSEGLKLKDFIPKSGGSCSINSCRTAPAANELNPALKMIRVAKQPVIFTGGGAVISGAFTEIAELSRILKAPVFSTISGKGIMVPKEDNYYFGTVGMFGERPNHKFLRRKADIILVVGNRLTEDDTANFKYPSNRLEMVQIDVDAAEIGLNYDCWGVVGDPKAAVFELIRKLRKKTTVARTEDLLLRKPKQEYENEILKEREKNIEWLKAEHIKYRDSDSKKWLDADPIKPQRILKSISQNFSENDYLVTDASASSRWVAAYFPVKNLGRHIITPRGVGPTGFGVGALIGTCIAVDLLYGENNNIKKILFTGDGGLMNGGINEFETISKLGLNCSIVVINNSALGFVKFVQGALFNKRYYNTDRPNTDFSRIVEAFGGIGHRVEKLAELDTVITKALNQQGFNLIDVVVDPNEYLPPSFF